MTAPTWWDDLLKHGGSSHDQKSHAGTGRSGVLAGSQARALATSSAAGWTDRPGSQSRGRSRRDTMATVLSTNPGAKVRYTRSGTPIVDVPYLAGAPKSLRAEIKAAGGLKRVLAGEFDDLVNRLVETTIGRVVGRSALAKSHEDGRIDETSESSDLFPLVHTHLTLLAGRDVDVTDDETYNSMVNHLRDYAVIAKARDRYPSGELSPPFDLTPVLKHPGHPDQKVHGRRGMAAHPVDDQADQIPSRSALVNSSLAHSPSGPAQLAAKQVADQARSIEPAVTSQLLEISKSVGAKMEGLEFALKSESSIARKIATKSIERGISVDEAAGKIADSVRYTMVLPESRFGDSAKTALSEFEVRGFKVASVENSFHRGDAYSGVNMELVHPSGMRMEMQFHTRASFRTKMANHHKYEEMRDPGIPLKRRRQLYREQAKAWRSVPYPKGWRSIGDLKFYSAPA